MSAGKQRPLRILISAFSCSPDRGSEPGNGWNWSKQAERFHDVWVLTSRWDHHEVPFGDHAHDLKLRFVYVSVPFWPRRLIGVERALRIYYILWQVVAPFHAWRLNLRVRFDVIHHVTMNTIEVPGFLWLLRPPFVWGPVGGAQLPPKAMQRYFGKGWLNEKIRMARKRLVLVNPFVRLAVRRAKAVIAANLDTERLLVECGARNVVREVDVGVVASTAPETHPAQRDDTFTIVWVGRLIPRKAPLLAVDVASELHRRNVSFRMVLIGDGPQRDTVQTAISRYQLEEHVTLLGAVNHQEMAHQYARGHVFLFTSLHDTSGTVILEAMQQRLPAVTLNHQGAAEMVDESSGIRIDIHSPNQVIHDMADAVQQLYEHPEQRTEMGCHARQLVADRYVWDVKGPFLQRLYQQIVNS